jgi:hypothetical protein
MAGRSPRGRLLDAAIAAPAEQAPEQPPLLPELAAKAAPVRGPYRKTRDLAEYLQSVRPTGKLPAVAMFERLNSTVDELLGEYGLSNTDENRRFCALRIEQAARDLAEYVHSKRPREVNLHADTVEEVRIVLEDVKSGRSSEVIRLDGEDMEFVEYQEVSDYGSARVGRTESDSDG